KKVEITNPINLAGDVTGKEFILDVEIMLNDDTLINLEMQVANEFNWPERSLSYLCRSYDQLYRGQKYEDVLPVIHIGFLDFTLHPEDPEFYATYKLLNVKNHRLYSSKFVLSVVNLNQIKLATEEDKAYNIDYWARIFKAKTWEEIKMLAKDNEYLHEAAESLYVANADEIVRQQCIARENAERRERTLERDNKLLKQELNEKEQENKTLRENVLESARNLFANGVGYPIVRKSIPSLSDAELQAIYKEVTGATYHE
ncbi:MAG: Rpn family recombination-promoting nuclease/putative transposase, partial [Tyzzerella sp.]|nr:Rpn family recombination-promoting nuclease/putative transposase [Tyzzerella sp.]